MAFEPAQNPSPDPRSIPAKAAPVLRPAIDLTKHPATSEEFAAAVMSILETASEYSEGRPSTKTTVILTPGSGEVLARTRLFERDIANASALPGIQYFPSEAAIHKTITEGSARLIELERELALPPPKPGRLGKILGGYSERDIPAEMRDVHAAINRAQTTLLANQARDIPTSEGPLRFTPFGREIAAEVQALSESVRLLYLRILARASICGISHPYTSVREHVEKLVGLGEPERDLRKLYMAFVEGLITPGMNLDRRFNLAKFSHTIDRYLESNGQHDPKSSQSPLRILRDEARYGSYPFPSYHPDHARIVKESHEVVSVGLAHSYKLHGRLAKEMERADRTAPCLFQQFAAECFDDVQGIYGSTIQSPPGRGFYVSGARTERLFFEAKAGAYDQAYNWAKDELQDLSDSSFIFTRGCIVAIHNGDRYKIEGEPFSYVIFNDHFTGGYTGAMLIPSKIITEKFRPALYDLASGDTSLARDITDPSVGAHLKGLITACHEKGVPPLDLTSISTLFTSCCGAYPIGWKKHFAYENSNTYKDLSFAWKDFTDRVHFAYRIWDFRHDRQRVQSEMQRFQDLHFAVEPVARRYQNMTDLLISRYGAWKNDVTPGEIDAPRMLVEAYRWHKSGTAKNLDPERFPKLCLIDRLDAAASPIPILHTADMKIEIDGKFWQLPTKYADGREPAEMTLWRRKVEPVLVSEGKETRYHLALLSPEYI